MKKRLIIFILFLSITPVIGQSNNMSFLRLVNGLEVIISPIPSTNAVSIITVHKLGVKFEPLDIKGTSFLLKDLIPICSSNNINNYSRVRIIKLRGAGEYNFFVGQDYSYLFQLFTPDLLDNSIWFEKERMESLRIPDNFIDQVKNRIYTNYMNLNSNNMIFKESNWITSQILKGTEYEVPVFGDFQKIKTISHNRIKRFYLSISEPQNTLMIICGKITEKQVQPILEKHFSEVQSTKILPGSDYIQKPSPAIVSKTENRLYDNIPQNTLLYGFSAPSKLDKDYFTYLFLVYYLLDNRISKLYEIFNITNQLDITLFSEFTNHIHSNGLIMGFNAKSRVNIEKVKISLRKIINNLKINKLSFNDIKLTKSLIKLDFLKTVNNLRDRPKILAEHYLIHKNLDLKEEFFKKLNTISAHGIINVVKKYFSKNYIRLNVYKK